MSATNQDIKDFFALIGKTVTNQHLAKMQDALATQRYGMTEHGEPTLITPDDFIDWVFRHAKAFVNRTTEEAAKAAVELNIPAEDLW